MSDPIDDSDELLAAFAVREAEIDAEVLSRMEFHELAHHREDLRRRRIRFGFRPFSARMREPLRDEVTPGS